MSSYFFISKKIGNKKESSFTHMNIINPQYCNSKEKKLSKKTPENPNYKIVCIHLVKDLFELYFSE